MPAGQARLQIDRRSSPIRPYLQAAFGRGWAEIESQRTGIPVETGSDRERTIVDSTRSSSASTTSDDRSRSGVRRGTSEEKQPSAPRWFFNFFKKEKKKKLNKTKIDHNPPPSSSSLRIDQIDLSTTMSRHTKETVHIDRSICFSI